MSAMTPKKEIFIVVTCNITKDDSTYVAICPEFDVASQGKTVEEANNNVKDAVLLYLNTIEELGTRKEIFKERKIKTYTAIPKIKKERIPVPIDSDHDSFTTINPIPLFC